ncbi:hypothetical protein KSC_022230 [Ktedonobacter sp. SOSP1-52]|uniref:hypothetical protein n=1 Tax=Ktedonobacter sp. SOSP1-52 TaxID=2778366 RepID=UPI001916314B|nr:hypothetical protein [Ktedonobacter sp. SOSP1-52]GHO63331.1 hypothetical protein KSC_022230 [Ktedonobacter sp. SOSP1-52]
MISTPLRRSIRGLVACFLALLSIFVFSSTPGVAASGFAFTTFELSSTPGLTCPGSGGSCTNNAAEPQIRADMAGHFYASSENGLGAGTEAWRSTDSGRHYTALVSPNAASQGAPVAPGGGDTDLATAPVKNASGVYTVYVASLNLANIDVSTSMDAGKTWKLNPTSATVPGDDREWIAADQASKVCISYHDVATFNIDVNCSYDAGTTFTQLGEAFDPTHAFLAQNNEIGNLVIDPRNHIIYQTFSGIANAGEVPCSQAGSCGYHVVWVAVSTDGGKTFTDHVVYNNPDTTVSYGHQFVNMSVDRAGNVYSVYSNNHNVSYSFSTNHATTWSVPIKVNAAPSNTAIMPWSVANQAGHIDIVWYGTSYSDGTTPPDTYPMSAAWYVYFAQNLKATTAGSSFSQIQATPIIHYGGVCEGGISCTGNRDLYDDFGVAVNPLTGMASIVYSDDQYTNDPNNPPQSGCTPSSSNSSSCNHTSIATQTSGTGI